MMPILTIPASEYTHQFPAFIRVHVYAGFPVEQREDVSCRRFGFSVVRSKGSSLTHSLRAEHYRREHPEKHKTKRQLKTQICFVACFSFVELEIWWKIEVLQFFLGKTHLNMSS